MSAGCERPRLTQGSWPGDPGARRLFEAVREACLGGADFPARLEAGLRAALELLAADPDLAQLLTVQPFISGSGEDLAGLRHWLGRFAELLRDAAADHFEADSHPRLSELFLLGGVRFQIARLTLNGEAADLPRLLPVTLDVLLAYYVEPVEARRLARGVGSGAPGRSV